MTVKKLPIKKTYEICAQFGSVRMYTLHRFPFLDRDLADNFIHSFISSLQNHECRCPVSISHREIFHVDELDYADWDHEISWEDWIQWWEIETRNLP